MVAKASISRIVFPLNECKLNAGLARTFRSQSPAGTVTLIGNLQAK
jgi:hypothetical protein